MEIRAYNEAYLDNAMVTMATMLDYAVNEKHEHIDYFFQCFLFSPYAQQFERGNPAFITGKTGVELYRLVRMDYSYPQPVYMSINRSPEYWVGHCLAFYQWYANRTFQEITAVVSLTEMLGWYPTLHEADIMRFVDAMNQRLAMRPTNLERLRTRAGLSQAMLSQLSGVHLRSIQMYEQRQNDISKAQFNILNALARTLGCTIYDLMDSEVSTQQNQMLQENYFLNKLQQDMEKKQREREQLMQQLEREHTQLQAYRYNYASQMPYQRMTPNGYYISPMQFQNNWNQYWNNVLEQQRMAEEQRRQQQKMLQKIAKEAIDTAIKATGNKQAEPAFHTACLFTSDNLLDATAEAIKVLQDMNELNQ